MFFSQIVALVVLANYCLLLGVQAKNGPLKQFEATCGYSRLRSGLIVGGTKAAQHEFPGIVSIQYQPHKEKPGQHFCAGSIISDRWILSAAHCLTGLEDQVPNLSVVAGMNNLKAGGEETYRVEKAIRHEGFDDWFNNDILLFRTDREIKMVKTPSLYKVNSVCLPPWDNSSNVAYPPPDVTAIGWGATKYDDPAHVDSEDLLKVEVPLVPYDQCNAQYYKHARWNVPIKDLCYGVKGKDACQGDSGGPILKIVDRRAYQVGVVSFGMGCGTMPGIYTEVAKFKDWIESKIY